MKQETFPNALRINRIRCILAIIVCILICIMVFIAVAYQMLAEPNSLDKEVGWKSYHLFTILANMLMAVAAAMCIPYAVDGMRYRNYHLPRWYVNLLYMGTSGVAMTFFIALTVLSPAVGFYRMMIYANDIVVHTACPVLSILLFFFINSDHEVSFKSSVIAIIPVILYSLAYLILVFVIGEEAGGWRDHYQIYRIAKYVPLPVIWLLVCFISLGVSTLLRIVHNLIHNSRKAALEQYYQQAEVFAYPDIQSAIGALAEINRKHDMGGELTVPRRILKMMDNKYHSGLSTEEMCVLYINEYYQKEADEVKV